MPTIPSPTTRDSTRRHALTITLALWVGVIAAALAVIGVMLWEPGDESVAPAPPSVVAGTPGGVAVTTVTPSPSATPAPAATPQPTPEPTPEATSVPATPEPTATPAPVPATPVHATPAPTAIVVAAGNPGDAVAAFYGHAAADRFDAAYSLWSGRMRASYPRSVNLDGRFDETASIAFEQLHVAEQGPDRATVQANFTETYESGSTRRFAGYWRLILVDGRWLLDEPHY